MTFGGNQYQLLPSPDSGSFVMLLAASPPANAIPGLDLNDTVGALLIGGLVSAVYVPWSAEYGLSAKSLPCVPVYTGLRPLRP